MAYFKINNVDYSMYVSKLKVAKEHIFKNRTNASGNTLVKYVNSKFIIEVGIIPLDDDVMAAIQNAINDFTVTVSFLDPETKQLVNANCMISQHSVEYYTIQNNNVKFKAFALVFTEL